MTGPATPPPIAVEMKLAGAWTDITGDVLVGQPIKVSRGRGDEAARTSPSKLSLSLLGTDGRYAPRNPVGPYYGLIGLNTPMRLSVRGAHYLNLPGAGAASTPHVAALNISGDIDVRADITAPRVWDNYPDFSAIVNKWDNFSGAKRSWGLLITASGQLVFNWSSDGTNTAGAGWQARGPNVTAASSGRLAVRATLDVDNGAGGAVVRFYTAPTMAGPWVQEGTDIVFPSTTSIFSTPTVPVIVGATSNTGMIAPTMWVHAVEVRNGIGGAVVANPDFTAQPLGTTSFADAAGRAWTLTGAATISDLHPRACGEVSVWPPDWDLSGARATVAVEAAGILRRLGQGKAALQSPMRREFGAPKRTSVWAYWPCEDGTEATALAAATPGASPLLISGAVKPGAYSAWRPSAPLPTIGTGRLTAAVPAHSAAGVLALRCVVVVPAGGVAAAQPLITLTGTGTAPTWILWMDASGLFALRAYDLGGTQLFDSGFGAWAAFGSGKTLAVGFTLTQNGANVDWNVYGFDTAPLADGSLPGVGGVSGTLASRTVGQSATITVGGSGDLGATALGHIAIADSATAYQDTLPALLGWAGELAQNRIRRLCGEMGIPIVTVGRPWESAAMGVQARDTLLNLLDACADVDGGILADQLDEVGLIYRNRASLYNQKPALALDYTARGEVPPGLRPVDDEQKVVNDVTVSRDRGASARVTLESGRLSVQDPPNGAGRYDTAPSLNLYQDTQCLDVAGWMLHLGTVDEPRYPRIPVNLAAAPHLIEKVLDLGLGDRATVANMPIWAPGDVDQLIQGWSETISPAAGIWGMVLNCAPASAWLVAQIGDQARDRLDTAGSQLAAGATSTATTLSVATTTGPTWTTNHVDTPLDLAIAGERVTVVAVGQQLATNPLLLTDLTGWTGQNATIARSTAVVNTDDGAAASIQITPNGSSASGGALGNTTAPGSITPGATYTVCMWAYSPGGWADLRPAVDWLDSSGVFLSSGLGSGTSVPAGQWTYIQQTLTAPASASMATPRARHGGTPPASAVWYAWAIRLVPAASVSAVSPQQMTVIRSRNGISKAQSAGAPVALADQSMILAL